MIREAGLWRLVEARARATPDALFAVDEGDRRLTFREYRTLCLREAARLAATGVGAGTAVSWMLPTWLESLVLVGALSRLGARQNPILPIYRKREVRFITRQLGSEHLLVPGEWRGFDYAEMAREIAREQNGLLIELVDGGAAATLSATTPLAVSSQVEAALPPAPGPAAANDLIQWIFYTSGTTADPKGALHTDGTLMATSWGMCEALALRADDRVAMVFPFTHIGGVGWLFSALISGCALIAVEAFDPATSIPVLERNGVTQATAGTAFHQAYLAAQRARGASSLFPAVRSFPGGGAPKPPRLHYELKEELGGAGIVSGYGMTECPILSMNRVGDSDDKLAQTEGRPCPPEVEIRVIRADGEHAATGEEGEFRVKGPQLCKGYLDGALDEEAFDDDGFFRTGDLGFLDADGYAIVTGRLKDVIIRKGENISAKEVEDLLDRHPKVAEVAVVGLPDLERGELCCAVVTLRDPNNVLRLQEMAAFLAEMDLMRQKIPERLEIAEALPRNATGKILKRELRERYAAP